MWQDLSHDGYLAGSFIFVVIKYVRRTDSSAQSSAAADSSWSRSGTSKPYAFAFESFSGILMKRSHHSD